MLRAILICLTLLTAVGCGHDEPPQPVRRVIHFSAVWCGPCQRDKPKLIELEKQGITVVHVDVDKNPTLAGEYKIKTVPTYVVCEGDKEVQRTHDIRLLFRLIRWLRRL